LFSFPSLFSTLHFAPFRSLLLPIVAQFSKPLGVGVANTDFWIAKFETLVGEIGSVMAIVTDWENPVLLTRIWCLFELNAAIDTGAELRFVASAV
jgi:hypothetical protein